MKENELKLEDVMCGDWVDVRNNASPNTPHIEKITPSHFLRDEHWYGIELTSETLARMGFTIEEEPKYDDTYTEDEYTATIKCVDSRRCEVEIEYNTYWKKLRGFNHDPHNRLGFWELKRRLYFSFT